MLIREKPRIKEEGKTYYWHDDKKGNYTKMRPSVNYCSIDVSKLPDKPGIYFLYEDEELQYIGRTKSIKKRISTHISVNKHIINAFEPHDIAKKMHKITRVEFELYPEEDLPWIEMFYICKLFPSANSHTIKYGI